MGTMREVSKLYEYNVERVCDQIRCELLRARSIHGPMRSTHEGWGVIAEEWREMQDAIMANDLSGAFKEAIQVAAMAASFVVDLHGLAEPICTREGCCGVDHPTCNGLPRRDP